MLLCAGEASCWCSQTSHNQLKCRTSHQTLASSIGSVCVVGCYEETEVYQVLLWKDMERAGNMHQKRKRLRKVQHYLLKKKANNNNKKSGFCTTDVATLLLMVFPSCQTAHTAQLSLTRDAPPPPAEQQLLVLLARVWTASGKFHFCRDGHKAGRYEPCKKFLDGELGFEHDTVEMQICGTRAHPQARDCGAGWKPEFSPP